MKLTDKLKNQLGFNDARLLKSGGASFTFHQVCLDADADRAARSVLELVHDLLRRGNLVLINECGVQIKRGPRGNQITITGRCKPA